MTDPVDTMAINLERNTGHDLDWWVAQAMATGAEKHGEMLAHLKSQLGLSHGYANFVALKVQEIRNGGPQTADDLVAGQYRGRESLFPIYERLLEEAKKLGPDVDVSPKKGSVSLRRSKQFALIEPATKTRIDLGLNLKGAAGTDRLRAVGGMCTHKVAVGSIADVDDELLGWLRDAYSRA